MVFLKNGTTDFQNSAPFEREACLYMTINENFEHFQYLNFENFFSVVSEPLIKSWFDVPTTQMPVFILFVNAGVLSDGGVSLWVSLNGPYDSNLFTLFKKWCFQ